MLDTMAEAKFYGALAVSVSCILLGAKAFIFRDPNRWAYLVGACGWIELTKVLGHLCPIK